MSPRLKLRAATPLVLAGALWGGTTLAPLTHGRAPYQAPCQTPPPCGPDGVCLPNYFTYGHYQTHWRPFPGDLLSKAPTKAEPTPQPGQDNLRGPQPPPPSEEGEIGKPRPSRGAAGAEESAAEPAPTGPEAGLTPGAAPMPAPENGAPAGLPAIPGGTGLPGALLPDGGATTGPGAGAAPAGPGLGAPGAALPETAPGGAPAPGGATAPGAPGAAPQEKAPAPESPEQKLVDPFGAAPPKPPAWLRSAAAQPTRAALKPLPLPAVQTAGISQPIGVMPVATPAIGLGASVGEASPAIFETPNLNSDDAPPALPSGLQGFTAAGISHSQAPSREAAPPTPPRQVVQASVEQPLADALVHQADALISDSPDAGLEQAIYFEASDQ